MRWILPLILTLVVVSDRQLSATDTAQVRKYIEGLSDPNVMTRANACHSLGQAGDKDKDIAVDALISALDDTSGSVRNAAIMALGQIGPGADKAIPSLIQLYKGGSVPKGELIRALARVGPDSPTVIDFLTEVVRGGRSGAVRPIGDVKCPTPLRHESIRAIEKIGPKAGKSAPVLLDLLNVAAADIDHHEQTFQATADALSVVGVGDKRVLAALKRFQQGKGLPRKKKTSQAFEHAVLAADSAVKRLQKAEDASGGKREEDLPKQQ